jgi:hypothetical protein
MATVSPFSSSSTSQGPLATDLPCDVEMILQTSCWSCHGITALAGAPMTLLTRDDLLAPSKSDPSKTNAQLSLERIASTSKPMPPAPASMLSADAVQVLTNWVQTGAPAGSCVGSDPYNTPSVCTSGSTWTHGNHGSSQMHPGGACIDCHNNSDDGPGFSFAGTVYPTAHEPDDCNGESGMQVVIIGSDGGTLTLNANFVGNFYSQRSSIALPFTAKVVSNGKERVMTTPQMSGDCNSCHTETGTMNAPGRIMAP